MQSTSFKVKSIEKTNGFLYRIFLTPSIPVSYKAGQYLSVVMGENDKRPFSIANAPFNNTDIELHIGALPENTYAMQVVEKMQLETEIYADIGNGEAFLQEASVRPIIILAGGTGFAYAKSLVEQAITLKLNVPIHLFWGVKSRSYLYFEEEMIQLVAENTNVYFTPVVELPEDNWNGKKGYVHQVILNEFDDLSPFDIYIAGRFEMAKKARDDFIKKNALSDHIFGDAFAFM
ncbi:MAG: NAD(P)H-flavin reductase [Psychromonas sp.]|nr:NAD(P)H-flavin reductase [Psychromonas sp.]